MTLHNAFVLHAEVSTWPVMEDDNNSAISQAASQKLLDVISGGVQSEILPSKEDLQKANKSLSSHLPDEGLELENTTKHLLDDVAPGLNASSLSANYYGFVTGGVTPAARIADKIVSVYDQNVSVHLPDQTVATVVEDRALQMLQELLDLDPSVWTGRTFTTGATASNVLGLACGRDAALQLPRVTTTAGQKAQLHNDISEVGILEACIGTAGINRFQVLTTMAHSSLFKAASIVGLGRANVIDIGQALDPLKFDFEKLVEKVQAPQTATILVVSCGEVNTGRFATDGGDEMQQLRHICDRNNIWMHVDGAFGIFGRALELGVEFDAVKRGCEGLDLADSITGDAHKLLNVVSRSES